MPKAVMNNSPYYITTNHLPAFGAEEDENVRRRIQVYETTSLPQCIPGIDHWIYDNAMDCIAWIAEQSPIATTSMQTNFGMRPTIPPSRRLERTKVSGCSTKPTYVPSPMLISTRRRTTPRLMSLRAQPFIHVSLRRSVHDNSCERGGILSSFSRTAREKRKNRPCQIIPPRPILRTKQKAVNGQTKQKAVNAQTKQKAVNAQTKQKAVNMCADEVESSVKTICFKLRFPNLSTNLKPEWTLERSNTIFIYNFNYFPITSMIVYILYCASVYFDILIIRIIC
jgi:hypothetical protein